MSQCRSLATHGRSGVRRVVYGSVAEQVLRSSILPVLLVRVPGAEAEEPGGAVARMKPVGALPPE